MKNYEKEYMRLTDEYAISAKKFFMVLRLALYHVLGTQADTSADVVMAEKNSEVWECACKILNTLYKERRGE